MSPVDCSVLFVIITVTSPRIRLVAMTPPTATPPPVFSASELPTLSSASLSTFTMPESVASTLLDPSASTFMAPDAITEAFSTRTEAPARRSFRATKAPTPADPPEPAFTDKSASIEASSHAFSERSPPEDRRVSALSRLITICAREATMVEANKSPTAALVSEAAAAANTAARL